MMLISNVNPPVLAIFCFSFAKLFAPKPNNDKRAGRYIAFKRGEIEKPKVGEELGYF